MNTKVAMNTNTKGTMNMETYAELTAAELATITGGRRTKSQCLVDTYKAGILTGNSGYTFSDDKQGSKNLSDKDILRFARNACKFGLRD